jgi:hypothetical protein
MSTDRKLAELLDAATADMPAGVRTPPLAAIHGRVRRRRRMVGVVTAAAIAVVLAGGYTAGQRMLTNPAPRVPARPAASPTPSSVPAVAWVSAMVARDDTTVTVYAGANRCQRLNHPQARVAAQDATRVTIEVTSRVVPAGDCTAIGQAVAVVVRLPAPLDSRKLVDWVDLRSHPVYYERYLPNLRSGGRWSPFDTGWQSSDVRWYQGYNGPNGSTLNLRAQPTGSVQQRVIVGTVSLGPYKGTITGNSAESWTVWWQAGGATYSLRLTPAEGGSLTLTRFKQQVAGLWT